MSLHETDLQNKRKRGSCIKHANSYFKEFCANTSVHGFKFLGERRTLTEKVWWVIVISLSLYACISLIFKTYTKWISSPVIVSFATTQTDISEIPFPAVTICTDVKTTSSRFKYSDVEERLLNGHNVTGNELRNYNYLNLVCDSDASISKNITELNSTDALHLITRVAPTVKEVITSIRWRGSVYKHTSNFFTPVLTSEGVCYTFNILDRKEIFTDYATRYKNFFYNGNTSTWDVEQGFRSNQRGYPRYSVVSGTAGGVDLVLTASEEDIDYRCSPDFVGFKVSLLHPALIPRGRKNFFSVPLNQIVLANVKPIILRTSEELRNYSPKVRKCYFGAERSLKFYKTYNQPNCLLECLTNYTLEHCGCVGFHMPRVSSTPICGFGSRKCMESAKALYLLPPRNSTNDTESYSKKCHCLPTCSALDYEVEISQSNWHWQRVRGLNSNASAGIHRSRLRVFFKYMQFVTSVRNELYGTTDFLASCGGLLGLFIGFSTVSLFEIIYFLTLRLGCNIKKYSRSNWFGTDETEM